MIQQPAHSYEPMPTQEFQPCAVQQFEPQKHHKGLQRTQPIHLLHNNLICFLDRTLNPCQTRMEVFPHLVI